MQTLDADAGTAHATLGLRTAASYGGGVTSCGVLPMDLGQLLGVHHRFEPVYAPFALEATDLFVELSVDKPVQGWHRCAVGEVGFIFNDDGFARFSTYNDREATTQRATEKNFDGSDVTGVGVKKGQRQNSSVCSRREKNPDLLGEVGVDTVPLSPDVGATNP